MNDSNAYAIDDGDYQQPVDRHEKRRVWLFEPVCELRELLERPLEESPLGQHLRDVDHEERAE